MPVTMFFAFINSIWNIELYCIVLKGDKLMSDKGDTEIYMGNEFKDHEHIIFFSTTVFFFLCIYVNFISCLGFRAGFWF